MRSGRKADKPAGPNARRDRLAMTLGIVTIVCLGAAFFTRGTQFLMPGPLASSHGAIENCGACHTKSGGGGKFNWIHGLVAGDPVADSRACISCHKMPETALNPHGAPAEVLKQSTRRLTKVAAATPAPLSANVQSIAFPTDGVVSRGLYCATCHQEHQGSAFNLSEISNEQCRSCHVVKFDSFDGSHPKFDNYPFQRRTRIVYDHAGHFGKHFTEVAQKDAAKRIPDTCSSCHNSRDDRRVMAVASFDQTCSSCHIDQITGKERVSGPKGVAFLSLPGLDVQTLKERGAEIGEWPEASEAELTPFMKVMISRTDRGRALIRTVDQLKLLDLSGANDEQIKAVTNLAWEIKGLFYALIAGRASDVLADIKVGGGGKLSASLVTDLTASIPRDVVISAHQEWLPNLGTEMANRPETSEQEQSGWSAAITESRLSVTVAPEDLSGPSERQPAPRLTPQAEAGEAAAAKPVRVAQAPQNRPADQTDDLLFPDGGAPPAGTGAPAPVEVQPQAPAASPAPSAQPAPRPAPAAAQPDAGSAPAVAAVQPRAGASGQTDDLLFPDGGAPEAPGGGAPPPDAPAVGALPDAGAPPADAPAIADAPGGAPAGGPAVAIQSDVDPESWAEYGGWYQQDYAISYRPTGHKDKFIYSWLRLTGPQAPKGDKGPAAAVFDYLTSKDAQGSCVKCHSVDDLRSRGRLVNFGPAKVETKRGNFTNFVHEPHFGIMENRGCLTCHNLEKGRPYLKSYEQNNPLSFASNFSAVKKELCQTCHTSGMARQDCLLCHKYHVDGVITPMMNTRLPTQ